MKPLLYFGISSLLFVSGVSFANGKSRPAILGQLTEERLRLVEEKAAEMKGALEHFLEREGQVQAKVKSIYKDKSKESTMSNLSEVRTSFKDFVKSKDSLNLIQNSLLSDVPDKISKEEAEAIEWKVFDQAKTLSRVKIEIKAMKKKIKKIEKIKELGSFGSELSRIPQYLYDRLLEKFPLLKEFELLEAVSPQPLANSQGKDKQVKLEIFNIEEVSSRREQTSQTEPREPEECEVSLTHRTPYEQLLELKNRTKEAFDWKATH